MNWAETPYPLIALILLVVTIMHSFSSHRIAWISRISAVSFLIPLALTVGLGVEEVQASKPASWITLIGILAFLLLSIISVLITSYDLIHNYKKPI